MILPMIVKKTYFYVYLPVLSSIGVTDLSFILCLSALLKILFKDLIWFHCCLQNSWSHYHHFHHHHKHGLSYLQQLLLWVLSHSLPSWNSLLTIVLLQHITPKSFYYNMIVVLESWICKSSQNGDIWTMP